MSSTYKVLCLSHNPALELSTNDWNNPDPAITAALHPADHEDFEDHQHCDLLIGAFSYPLYRVGCPGERGHLAHGRHSITEWVDIDWLRLLYAAMKRTGAATEKFEERNLARYIEPFERQGCWTRKRLDRLRDYLVISD